jgi:iron only hydrogenase large subunit-like protein
MPCYDKKLEAVRPDFVSATEHSGPIKEIDNVLATHELIDLIQTMEVDFTQLQPRQVDLENVEMKNESDLLTEFLQAGNDP